MTHLVIDARTIRPGATGVGHFVAGLLGGLDRLMEGGRAQRSLRVTALRLRWTERRDPAWEAFWDSLRHVDAEDTAADYEHHFSSDLWLQRDLPELVASLEGDVLVSPAFIGPWGRGRFRRLLILPDAIAWDMPGNLPANFRWYLRAMSRLGARRAGRVASLSPPSARRLERLGFGGERGVGVVPCGIDPRLFHPAGERPRVLPDGRPRRGPLMIYTASFEKRKNHRLLFEMLRGDVLKDWRPELVLLHAASEDDFDWVARAARGLDVRVHKPTSVIEVAEWTRAADVALFPSRMEGFGTPALEAMACGTPLVAAEIDAMRWLTQGGRCAALAAPDDAAAWSRAVASILDGGSEAARRREAGLRRAAQFTWERAARRLLKEAGVKMDGITG